MTKVTKAEFARMQGVSKPAVGKWEKSGWIVLSEGKVDVEQTEAKLARYRNSKDGRATAAAQKSKPGASKPTPPASKPADGKPAADDGWKTAESGARRKPPAGEMAPRDDETPQQAAERIVRTLGADMGLEEAKRVKENYLALLNKLEYEEKDGALVSIDVAKKILFEAARAARDAWLNFPARIGPMLAADLGLEADKVTEALTPHVHKQVADLGEPSADFVGG
ncbi:hypothetical protein [uncultured Pseudacidovorax sp.]|uniref:hypothetical protein n=1 Tax=uncultured Pseudacidovorax sp. TaxID=679313 RepID=UPI0025D7174A|nr:hypothetical protein [uncultured Pseudacidovorax sp.]